MSKIALTWSWSILLYCYLTTQIMIDISYIPGWIKTIGRQVCTVIHVFIVKLRYWLPNHGNHMI